MAVLLIEVASPTVAEGVSRILFQSVYPDNTPEGETKYMFNWLTSLTDPAAIIVAPDLVDTVIQAKADLNSYIDQLGTLLNLNQAGKNKIKNLYVTGSTVKIQNLVNSLPTITEAQKIARGFTIVNPY